MTKNHSAALCSYAPNKLNLAAGFLTQALCAFTTTEKLQDCESDGKV